MLRLFKSQSSATIFLIFYFSFWFFLLPISILYLFRYSDFVHGFLMFFYQNPLLFKVPPVALIFFFNVFSIPRISRSKFKNFSVRDLFWVRPRFYDLSGKPTGAVVLAVLICISLFLILMPVSYSINQTKLSSQSIFLKLDSLPDTKALPILSPGLLNARFQNSYVLGRSIIASFESEGRLFSFTRSSTRLDYKNINKKALIQFLNYDLNRVFYKKDYWSDLDVVIKKDRVIISQIGYRTCLFCLTAAPYLEASYVFKKDLSEISDQVSPKLISEVQKSYKKDSSFYASSPELILSPSLQLTDKGPVVSSLVGSQQFVSEVLISNQNKNSVFNVDGFSPDAVRPGFLGNKNLEISPVFSQSRLFYLFSVEGDLKGSTRLVLVDSKNGRMIFDSRDQSDLSQFLKTGKVSKEKMNLEKEVLDLRQKLKEQRDVIEQILKKFSRCRLP